MRQSALLVIILLLLSTTLVVSAQTAPAVSSDAQEVQKLRDEVAEQREQIRQLKSLVDQLAQKTQAQPAAAAPAPAAPQAAAQAQNTYTPAEKQVAKLQQVTDRFRLGGDIRVRFQPEWQENTADRFRSQLRVRLGLEGKLSEEFVGGAYLATGALNNPTGTNEAFTNNFNRFNIGLDRGWITYKPKYATWLELTGGKFAFTWNRTSLTFDPDVNPTGFSEKFTFKVKNNVLKQVSVTGLQLFANEVAGTGVAPISSGADTYAVGGQVSTNLRLGERVTTTVSGMALNWRNADAIARAISGTTPTIVANKNTNATIGTGNNLRFASKFLYTDIMANTTVQTGVNAFPLRILLDYVWNPRAASNNDMGYYAEGALGRNQERNDIQFGYAFARVEQDAIIAAFGESEFRAPTNVLQHRVFWSWLPQRNTTALVTYWFGHTLNRNLQNAALPPSWAAGKQDAQANKIQFDLIYKF